MFEQKVFGKKLYDPKISEKEYSNTKYDRKSSRPKIFELNTLKNNVSIKKLFGEKNNRQNNKRPQSI